MKRDIAPVSILPCCILVTFIKTAVFLLCMTVTVILKLICEQKISCLKGNHYTGNNLHVVAALTRSVSFFPHCTDLRGIFAGCTEGLEDAT